MVRVVNREVVVLLGWGRAILLQVAHPLVASGVADHSDFGSGPGVYIARTRHTVGAMLSLTFGSPDQVRATADRINVIHRRVNGRVRDTTARFPTGTAYSATDPELLRWVHTTLVDSQLAAYQMFVAPLSRPSRDQYCAEAAQIAPLFGIPSDFLPTTEAEVADYLETRYRGGVLEVTDTARRLSRDLLFPSGRYLAEPLLAVGRLATVGLLPPVIRRAYGFPWDDRRQRRLLRLAALIRVGRRLVPRVAREWRAARQYRTPTTTDSANTGH